jgi:putative glutamine amidotransferase
MWCFLWLSLRLAGARPLRITPDRPASAESLDGLLLSGGADISPSLYGEEPEHFLEDLKQSEPTLGGKIIGALIFPLLYLLRRLSALARTPRLAPKRDELEQRLLKEALQRRLPVFGICRGMQLLNVAEGGSLYQDISALAVEVPRMRTVLPRKLIAVEPGSHLALALGRTSARVNALHHQAVRDLGRGMAIAARDETGMVQAVEHTTEPFILGVQWHPEFLPHKPEQRALFRAFVEACKKMKEE